MQFLRRKYVRASARRSTLVAVGLTMRVLSYVACACDFTGSTSGAASDFRSPFNHIRYVGSIRLGKTRITRCK